MGAERCYSDANIYLTNFILLGCFALQICCRFKNNIFISGTKIFSPVPQNQNNRNRYSKFLLFEVNMQGYVPDQSYIKPPWVEKDAFAKVTYSSWMTS
jgi:hypothetical protein